MDCTKDMYAGAPKGQKRESDPLSRAEVIGDGKVLSHPM